MKNTMKIGLLLLIAVISITVVTATDNKDLPSQDEVNTLLEEAENQNLNASEVMSLVKEKLPNANVDLLEKFGVKAVKVYWKDTDSENGYGKTCYADYRGGDSKIVSSWILTGYELKESYKGELGESDDNTEENSNETDDENDSNVITDSETSSAHTYKAFKTALDEYDGTFDCTSKSCATSLKDYYKNLGWDTEVKYCVAVTTSDEGTVYVVLGA